MASINATNAKMPLRPNDRASFPPSSLSTIISLEKTGIIQDPIAFTAGLQRVE